MAEIELIMPKMGESVAEATITNWIKAEGDKVELDETVIEIATDKVDSEIPSPVEGVLKKILFQVDDVVQVGQAIAIIETEGTVGTSASSSQSIEVKEEQINVPFIDTPKKENKEEIKSASGKFYSPLVKTIAQKEGISSEELDSISGSGQNNRVTKEDLLNYIDKRVSSKTVKPTSTEPVKQEKAPKKVIPLDNGDELIKMDRMRKMISEHMTMSKSTSAHVTSFVEADVTNMVMWRNRVKNEFLAREGEKITFTPIIMEAVAKAIKELPMINVSVDGENIIKRKNINLGMATALPSGNLIVPVIKNADQMNLVGLTKSVNDLANRARNNKLGPDEIQGGTFTVTNVGTFGNVMGTPIINQPQVAIMAVGAIRKKPAVIETEFGDTIGVRHMMFLSLSYDHRVVDGSLGGSFVQKVAAILEDYDMNREI